MQISSVFVPDATTYARHAIAILGKMDSSTGYWAHSIQKFFTLMTPVWFRMKVGQMINVNLRQEYFQQREQKELL